MRVHRILSVVALLAAGFAACDLNPQPLPPGSEGDNAADPGSRTGGGFSDDASFKADAGAEAPPAPLDADAAPNNGASDGGDGGDGGDSGDAGGDADADAS